MGGVVVWLGVTAGGSVQGTVYRSLSFGEVLPRAEVVVRGTVVRAEEGPRGESFGVRVDEVLSGSLAQGRTVTVHRPQVRSSSVRSAHIPGQAFVFFLEKGEGSGGPPGAQADYQVVGLDAEGEIPVLQDGVFLTGVILRGRSPYGLQTTDVLGVRTHGYPVDPEGFVQAIRSYPETRRQLLQSVGGLGPCSSQAMSEAAEALSQSPEWSGGPTSSTVELVIRDAVLGECEQAFKIWEISRTIPASLAADVGQLVERCRGWDAEGERVPSTSTASLSTSASASVGGSGELGRDGAVLQAALVDLLSGIDSPVEGKKEDPERIIFSMTSLQGAVSSSTLLQQSSTGRPQNPHLDMIPEVREAALDLVRRAGEKDLFTTFPITESRIVLEEDVPNPSRGVRGRSLWDRPQVFRAFPPGYSRDGRVAVVFFAFPWSGNMHSGRATVVLVRQEDGRWVALTRDFIYYV